jgi:hypothetical protein
MSFLPRYKYEELYWNICPRSNFFIIIISVPVTYKKLASKIVKITKLTVITHHLVYVYDVVGVSAQVI